MTQDPNLNVVTTPEGETIMLEPGDEGYVEPGTQAEGEEPNAVLDPQPMPADAAPPPQDLRLMNEAGQSESEAILHSRGTVVESTSPSDIVPNTPQIRPFPSEAVEVVEEPVVEEEQQEPDLLAEPEPQPAP